jgi:hypothetical protein
MKKLIFGVLLLAGVCYSNPIVPCYRPVITEIQVTDSSHWNIEIVESGLASTFKPCSTKAFSLYTDSTLSDSIHARPLKSVFMDTILGTGQWIGVITQSNLPYVHINPGDTIVIKGDSCNQKQRVPFSDIPSNQSLVSTIVQYFGYLPPDKLCCFPNSIWVPEKTPTLGKLNNTNDLVGKVEGHVHFQDGSPISDIAVLANAWSMIVGTCYPDFKACTPPIRAITDSTGYFEFTCVSGANYDLFFFNNIITKQISKKTVPIEVAQDSIITVDIILDDYTSVTIPSPSKKQIVSDGRDIRIINIPQASLKRGVSVVVSKEDESKGTINIEFYSTDGKLVHLSNIASGGSGTYSCFWDSRDAQGKLQSVGTYICKVQSGNSVITQTFILMQ